MNAEFFDAIEAIEREKGIPRAYMHEKIAQALATAYKRDHPGCGDNVVVEFDDVRKKMMIYLQKEVVGQVENPALELTQEQARAVSPQAVIGDIVNIDIETRDFGRIAAQTAKQVIIQGIREAERGLVFQAYTSKEHELISAQVLRMDPRSGNAILEIGGHKDKTEVVLVPGEQSPEDHLKEGDHVRVYVVEVRKAAKGPQILISRTHPGLVKRLFELEVPEVSDGIVEVRSIAREAGYRTKMAVSSNDEKVDPVGACIGQKRARIAKITEELRGEKVDIIKYSDDPASFVAASLSPADVLHVELLGEGRSCQVTVPEDQLSLAIGKEGQNARLAAKLTGYKIDIKPQSV